MTEQNEDQTNRILGIVGAELQRAGAGNFTAQITQDRDTALEYYVGNLPGAAPEGRSQIVSTDVADAVEWILPQIIKELTAKGPIISFDAVSEEDEEQARLETEFVHDTFMGENKGFLILYEFVKDALLQKNGILKIFYDDTPETVKEEYTGLNQQQFQMLLASPEVELVNQEEIDNPEAFAQHQEAMAMYKQQPEQVQWQQPPPQPPGPLIDAVVQRTTSAGRVVVECIPPEEFRIKEYHNSLSPAEAGFVAHVMLKTRSDLIKMGYDSSIIEDAQSGTSDEQLRNHRFQVQNEGSGGIDSNATEDNSQDLIEVSECYMEIDPDQKGVATLMKITTIGGDTPTDILDMEEIEEIPFVSSSCIIMPHKFNGMSIYDRIKQIQDNKTSLWRNINDNLYLQNNREKEVVENMVNLDDLIMSRPGGIKRVKAIGSIRELDVQPIGQEGFQMLAYLDTVRTGRTGVSPDTMGANMPVNETAHGTERLMTAKEELTGLMIRTIAETGIKEAYILIRDLLVRHQNTESSFKFRGAWAQVIPTSWGRRSRTTVEVGAGTGDDLRRVQAVQGVITLQEKLLASEFKAMVPPEMAFNALDEYCESSGLPGAENYFLDPKSEKGQQAIQQMQQSQQAEQQKMDEMNAKIADAQTQLAQAEVMKGQAALQSQQVKAQAEQAKITADATEADLRLQLDQIQAKLDDEQAEQANKVKYTQIDTQERVAHAQMDNAITLKAMELEMNAANAEEDREERKEEAIEGRKADREAKTEE